jgi:hypothetical protein
MCSEVTGGGSGNPAELSQQGVQAIKGMVIERHSPLLQGNSPITWELLWKQSSKPMDERLYKSL